MDMSESPTKVIVVGAGIAGLATAYYLEKKAREKGSAIQVTLLEASGRIGGKIITEHVDEFTVEGGPDSFVTEKPAFLELCHDLGLGGDLIPSNEIQRKVYVLRNGKPIEFPAGFRLTIPTEIKPFIFSPLISMPGKLRMAMDIFVPPLSGDGDVTLGEFIGRRLGKEAVDRIAGPLMAGIFVSDPYRLSMKSTFPRFLAMEKKYGSLIRAARAGKKNPPPPNPLAAGNAMFNSLKHGVGSILPALQQRIAGPIQTNTPVAHIERKGEVLVVVTKQGDRLEADHVVLCTPAYLTAGMVKAESGELAERLNAIRYVSTATVSMGFLLSDLPAGKELDGFGVMIPPSEKRDVLAVTWSSVKFRHRAPRGCFLLRAFIGGYSNENAAVQPDDVLLASARKEFESLFGITQDPIVQRIYRWTKGNPQYDVGHLDRVDELERLATTIPGLHLAGSAYRGIGMPDCVHSARTVAERILA